MLVTELGIVDKNMTILFYGFNLEMRKLKMKED